MAQILTKTDVGDNREVTLNFCLIIFVIFFLPFQHQGQINMLYLTIIKSSLPFHASLYELTKPSPVPYVRSFCFTSPLDNFGTVVGENPDRLLLSGTVVGENPDHVCWEKIIETVLLW